MSIASSVRIRVNGVAEMVAPATTPADILLRLGLDGPGIAVAVNDAVIRKNELGKLPLADGDRIEIIRAVGGG